MEFRLLGGVEARVDGRRVEIGPAKQQCVLVALLVDANTAVSTDRLIDRVWADRAPLRVRNALHSYLTRLRRDLGVRITHRSGNYVLSVDERAVDLHRFRDLVREGQVEQALDLWRGEAFAGLDTPWLTSVRATLDQERTAAELDLTDLRLRRGQHAELLAPLAAQSERRPLDERLAAQLMLALHRSGRASDALAHYQRTRARLVEELGVEPGTALRELHQRVLADDLAFTPPSQVPNQLPAAPRAFTARGKELVALDTDGVVVIGGPGGIGKTWLALHWAHQNVDRFPDGQLFVNLRGFDPSGEPMSPEVVVRGFLEALGITAVQADPYAQYRSALAGKRMLVVLDNARDAAQVVPLLPGTSTTTVLVTSRHRLAGLVAGHGAQPLPLDVLSEAESRDLLDRRLGADAEPDAVTELVSRTAGLPLALGIVAARAATDPALPLGVLAAELRDTSTRLGALDAGDPTADLSAVLSWSLDALPPDQAEAFRLLGNAPGPDIGVSAASHLLDMSEVDTVAILRSLERASLLSQHLPGRFRMHDLVRLYAASAPRSKAVRRLLDHYTRTAYAGRQQLDPRQPSIELDQPAPQCHADKAAALRWFDAEHDCLLAALRCAVDHGWHTTTWHLVWSLHPFQYGRGHLHHQVTTWQHGLAAARLLEELGATAIGHQLLGYSYAQVGRHPEAAEHLNRSLALAGESGDRLHEAHTHMCLLSASWLRGEEQEALRHAARARHLFQEVGDHEWAGIALNALGMGTTRREDCEEALAVARRHHHRPGEAAALDSLGVFAHRAGEHAEAVAHYRQALVLHRELGHTSSEADTLDRLGHPHAALGDLDEARRVWREAARLYRVQRRTADAERVQRQLG